MSYKQSAVGFALVAALATPAAAWAFTGPGGCSGLPEYYRALGTLQGNMENACNMTLDEARRIVAAYGGPVPAVEPPAPHVDRRHDIRRPGS